MSLQLILSVQLVYSDNATVIIDVKLLNRYLFVSIVIKEIWNIVLQWSDCNQFRILV